MSKFEMNDEAVAEASDALAALHSLRVSTAPKTVKRATISEINEELLGQRKSKTSHLSQSLDAAFDNPSGFRTPAEEARIVKPVKMTASRDTVAERAEGAAGEFHAMFDGLRTMVELRAGPAGLSEAKKNALIARIEELHKIV